MFVVAVTVVVVSEMGWVFCSINALFDSELMCHFNSFILILNSNNEALIKKEKKG